MNELKIGSHQKRSETKIEPIIKTESDIDYNEEDILIQRYKDACELMSERACKVLEYIDDDTDSPVSFWLVDGNALRLTPYTLRNSHVTVTE